MTRKAGKVKPGQLLVTRDQLGRALTVFGQNLLAEAMKPAAAVGEDNKKIVAALMDLSGRVTALEQKKPSLVSKALDVARSVIPFFKRSR